MKITVSKILDVIYVYIVIDKRDVYSEGHSPVVNISNANHSIDHCIVLGNFLDMTFFHLFKGNCVLSFAKCK